MAGVPSSVCSSAAHGGAAPQRHKTGKTQGIELMELKPLTRKSDFSLPFPGSSNAPSLTTQNNTKVKFVAFIKKYKLILL